VEERDRPFWTVLVGVPVADESDVPQRLPRPQPIRAPTPTAETTSLPALVVASFPLTSDRRFIERGAVTEFLLQRVADAYTELFAAVAHVPAALALVPEPGVASAVIDAQLSAKVLGALRDATVLPAQDGV